MTLQQKISDSVNKDVSDSVYDSVETIISVN